MEVWSVVQSYSRSLSLNLFMSMTLKCVKQEETGITKERKQSHLLYEWTHTHIFTGDNVRIYKMHLSWALNTTTTALMQTYVSVDDVFLFLITPVFVYSTQCLIFSIFKQLLHKQKCSFSEFSTFWYSIQPQDYVSQSLSSNWICKCLWKNSPSNMLGTGSLQCCFMLAPLLATERAAEDERKRDHKNGIGNVWLSIRNLSSFWCAE